MQLLYLFSLRDAQTKGVHYWLVREGNPQINWDPEDAVVA